MSSISSASSSTTVATLSSLRVPRPMWSTARPGVATTTSTPRSSARSCVRIGWPPYTGRTRTPSWRPYLWTASETCIASSRVGTRTSAVGSVPRSPVARRWSTGSAKAAVLPVPVAAWPSRSRPSTSGGIVSRWIGVGSS
jgi:hypothetical protein